MRVIVLAQQKGGAAKTCIAINLACEIAAQGEKVLILDVDEGQHSAFTWGQDRGGLAPEVWQATPDNMQMKLRSALKMGFSCCIIDTAGRTDTALGMALANANFVIVPCRPSGLDIDAAISTIRRIQIGKKPYGIVLSAVIATIGAKEAKKTADWMRSKGLPVCPEFITQRVAISRAIDKGLSLREYEPRSPGVAEFANLLKWTMENCK